MTFNYGFIGRMSCVAGIVDRGGGIRVVVTYPELLHHHIGVGERCFKVPDVWVQEPVGWERVPSMIDMVTQYVSDQMKVQRDAGLSHICEHVAVVETV